MRSFFIPVLSLVAPLSLAAATPNQGGFTVRPAVEVAGQGAVIDNGLIRLGVRAAGNLNVTGQGPLSQDNLPNDAADNNPTTAVGLRMMVVRGQVEYEATAPGCLCEGWGVSVNQESLGASANLDDGPPANMTLSSFTSPDGFAQRAVSVVQALNVGTIAPSYLLEVTHDFHPSAKTQNLYEATVSIKNLSPNTLTDLRYARVMDWDVENDTFNEYVTIKGTGSTSLLEYSHDDGFEVSNPKNGLSTDALTAGTTDTDFTDAGPLDHGAYFLFNFGSIDPNETKTFNIYYGAAPTEAQALAAIGLESIELYSLGQSADDPTGGSPATFIFGFKGVGGRPIEPNPEIPEASTVLGALGLAGLMGSTWLRRRAQAVQA